MKVSIIVPVYNTEEMVLRKCIESILAQTFKDFELILINDGSINNVDKIISSYNDNCIRYITKQNGGVSSARNAGLKIATGDWIVFVDSDDSLMPNHLEALMAVADDEIDMIVCGHTVKTPNDILTYQYSNHTYRGKRGISQLLSQTDFLNHQTPWDKAYKSSIIQRAQLRFHKELSISEDRLFVYTYLLYTENITTISTVTYFHYEMGTESLSGHYPPVYVQVLRYKLLLNASMKLVNYYGLVEDGAKRLLDYNLTMLDLALHLPCPALQKAKNLISTFIYNPSFFFRYIIQKKWPHR